MSQKCSLLNCFCNDLADDAGNFILPQNVICETLLLLFLISSLTIWLNSIFICNENRLGKRLVYHNRAFLGLRVHMIQGTKKSRLITSNRLKRKERKLKIYSFQIFSMTALEELESQSTFLISKFLINFFRKEIFNP